MSGTPGDVIYQARLTESGLALEDSAVLCAEYIATRDWGEVKSTALRENSLGKGSRSRISKLLRAVERRIFDAAPPLHRPLAIARFLAAESKVTAAAKVQLLLVLTVSEDRAFGDAFHALVIPAAIGTAAKVLDSEAIPCFLSNAAKDRPEVARWSEQTRARWAQGFRLVLREAGFVGSTDKSTSVEIRSLVVRDEVVAFLAHMIADGGVSGWSILRHETIANLLPTESDALRAARALNDRGWWSFAQSGSIIELRRNHASLEEWLGHGLGI
jgi:hypothetical protein